MAEKWQTVTEACQTLAISQRTLYRRIDKGEIESKVENRRRFVLLHLPDGLPEADIGKPMANTELIDELRARIEHLGKDLESANQQIEEKDKQISELHQLLMTAERRSQLLLEYKQPFWKRWFQREKKDKD